MHTTLADVGRIAGESCFVDNALLDNGAVHGESVWWRGGSSSSRGGWFWGRSFDERFEDRVLFLFALTTDFLFPLLSCSLFRTGRNVQLWSSSMSRPVCGRIPTLSGGLRRMPMRVFDISTSEPAIDAKSANLYLVDTAPFFNGHTSPRHSASFTPFASKNKKY